MDGARIARASAIGRPDDMETAEREPEMANVIPALDIEKLTEGVPRGRWVAIASTPDRRVATGADLDEAIRNARAAGTDEPLVIRVPESDAALIL